jgi:hypothetical protein
MLVTKHAHRFFQTSEGHGVHAVAHQLLDDANALAVLPNALGRRVDPHKFREGVGDYGESLQS